MIFKMIDKISLAMLAQEVKFDLARGGRPLEVVQRLRGLYLYPTGPGVHDPLHHILVVTQQQNVLVQLCGLSLLVQRQ